MTTPAPLRRCAYDGCCSFAPASHNAIYCTEHKCKRRAESSRKRLGEPIKFYDETTWELEENRKLARAQRNQAKNEWILSNKKFVFFDLETFELAADFGLVLVGCVKERKGEIHTFVAHGDEDEKAAVLGIRDALERADYVCTYYGTRFDIPYLNTRLLINGFPPVNQLRQVDLYYVARYRLRLNRNRLENVELALFGDEVPLKTKIRPGVWRRALQGSAEDLYYIIDHCQRDVELLEKVFEHLRGFINLSSVPIRRYGAGYGGLAA